MFFMAMNILMWTVASFIITRDRRYISVRKIFLNPSTIAMFVALALFFGRVRLPAQLDDAVSLLSKMCTPLCMLILACGWRSCRSSRLHQRAAIRRG